MSFTIEYYISKFFNLFHAFVISFSAYLVYFFSIQLNIIIYLSIFLSIVISSVLGVSSEYLFFRPLRKTDTKPFQLMIASLGLYLIFQNILSLIWGDTSLSIRQDNIEAGYKIFNGYITGNQIITIFISSSLMILTQVFLKYSSMGINLRAVSSNSSLSNIWGINTNRVFICSFFIGSLIASVAGILVAYETDLAPNMGFNLFLYGAIVMIIGGTGNIWGLVEGAFLLAIAQHLGAYFIDSKWLDVIAYITLILFLVFKPLGFNGKQLKKVEV